MLPLYSKGLRKSRNNAASIAWRSRYINISPFLNFNNNLRAGLHYGGEGLRSVKNAWPRHGYMRQMVDVHEKN